MEIFNLKKDVEFEKGRTYSICFRGAREKPSEDIEIYTPKFYSDGSCKYLAKFVGRQQFRFIDLISPDFDHNYDPDARTKNGLVRAMGNAYPDFDEREIVTIVKFSINL